MTEDKPVTFTEHLEELRQRLIISILSVVIFSAFSYHWSGWLFKWLAKPVGSFVFLAPTEAFVARLKIALIGGFFLAIPIILFQIWRFVVTALTHKEKKALFWILPGSYSLFLLGSFLAFSLVIPTATRFLMTYGSEELKPLISINAYLRFVFFLVVAFGVLFQLPLVLFFLNYLGVVDAFRLASWRRFIYIGAFVAAALLTPGPDIFSQILLAVPTILLYEISLIAMRWASSKQNQKDEQETEEPNNVPT